ncbi:MAG: branched-chain amino acid ABC transporter substrate-binding protein [Actinomycetota bacterium]|nr:branched-chain amino acid ABC transporter substrate-binding protein [Actinomycetota bacterium]
MKKNMSTRLVAVLGALALVAAACGGGVDFEAGELGAVTVEGEEAIQIRSLNAITGPVAFLGIPNENAIRMAVEDYGPIQGHDVEVGTGLDDLCSADGGQSAAATIVADDAVVGVIGTSCSGAAAAASPLISDAGLVMVSASNTSPSLTSDLAGTAGENYYEGYYRTAHNDLFQGQAAANFVFDNLGLTKVALIHDGDPYTNGLTTAFQDAFIELGGEIVVHTAVAVGDTDMVPVLTEVAGGNPELIFFPIFPAEATAIVQQIAGVAGLEDVLLMAADGASVTNFMEIAESEGMYFSGPDTRFAENTNEATGVNGEKFLSDYESEWGEPPSADFWGHAYDATTILLTAIEEVAVVDGDKLHIDRALLRQTLSDTSGFAGLIGSITCDEFGDCGAAVISIFQHVDIVDHQASKANILYTYSG